MTKPALISPNHQLNAAIERAEKLKTALEVCGRAEQAKALSDIINAARQLKFAIGVVGEAKRGKSTLINGLLGQRDDRFAPINKKPATNVVSCFAGGLKEEVKVIFQSDKAGKPDRLISTSEIKHYACEQFNPGNEKAVEVIEVVGPFPNLGLDVVLVDTPGAYNALSNMHDAVLLKFLPKLDAVIFLVTADAPLTRPEVDLLKHVRKSDVNKLLLTINKADKCDPEELSEGREANREALADAGFKDVPIFEISAKNFLETGSDDGTERLLFAVGEMIGEGRAKVIAERLTDSVNRNAAEAKQELATALQMCEMTAEQAKAEKAELAALQMSLGKERPGLERKFRAAWKGAISAFEDALPSIEKRMVSEYGGLIERTSPLKLQAFSQTVHTDVLKRLDELLETPIRQMREKLEAAGKALEVDYRGIPGLAPRQTEPVRTNKDMGKAAVEVAAAGIPAGVCAFVCASLPGLVGTTIAAAAPAVVSATWNPLTWLAAFGTGTAAAATGVASGAAAVILSPLAAVGAPLLIAYTGYRVISTWKSKLDQSKNALSLAVKDLIIAAVAETRTNFQRLKEQDEDILAEFNHAMDAKLDESESRLDTIMKKRPTLDFVDGLKRALQNVEALELAKGLPGHEANAGATPRLFSGND